MNLCLWQVFTPKRHPYTYTDTRTHEHTNTNTHTRTLTQVHIMQHTHARTNTLHGHGHGHKHTHANAHAYVHTRKAVHYDCFFPCTDAPLISGFPTIFSTTEYSRLEIDCSDYTVVGNPSLTTYKWTTRGSTFTSESALVRGNISRNEGGLYTCTASNAVGSVSSSIGIDVHCKGNSHSKFFQQYCCMIASSAGSSCGITINK